MFKKKIKISNKRSIGDNQPCFIIGEIGSNHNRDKSNVKKLIEACAKAKFDAVKFQLYDPELAFSKKLKVKDVGLSNLYNPEKPWWLVARDKILMPKNWFKEMYSYARKKGLIVFSTVHNIEDYNFLKKIGVPIIKIAKVGSQYTFPLCTLVVGRFIDEMIKFTDVKDNEKKYQVSFQDPEWEYLNENIW